MTIIIILALIVGKKIDIKFRKMDPPILLVEVKLMVRIKIVRLPAKTLQCYTKII